MSHCNIKQVYTLTLQLDQFALFLENNDHWQNLERFLKSATYYGDRPFTIHEQLKTYSMKKISMIFGAFLALFIISCDGEDGRDGVDGADGVNIVGQVLEIEGDFTPGNNYSIFYEFPNTVEVFESDIVLVYIRWEETENSAGEPVDVWRLLPQTRLLDQGILQYNYDHTYLDATIFLESDFDLGTLLPSDTDNQIFRIAIMPADFAQAKVDRSNIASVMQAMGVTENEVQKVSVE